MNKIFKIVIQFKNIDQNIQKTGLIDFGLPCTLNVNSYVSYVFKFNLKNIIRYIRIYNQCTGQSKIDQAYSFHPGFRPNFSEYFDLTS